MCKSLAAAGHEVHLVAPGRHEPAVQVVDGVSVHLVPPGRGRLSRMTSTMNAALRTGAALRGDVYHFHDPEFLRVAPRWQRRLGVPFVYDVHEDYREGIRDKTWLPRPLRRPIAWAWGRLEDHAAARLAGVVAATPAIGERFLGHACTEVVQNMPLIEELAPRQDEGVKTPGLFVYVGVLSEPRGAREMIQALGGVAGGTLALAGECVPSTLRDECARLPGWVAVRECGMLNRDEVRRLLAGAVAGVVLFHPLGNHLRAQPNKLFEYMAAGLPVVASDFPLWRSIVERTGCGLLVDPLDTVAISHAMRWVVDHPVEARAMGARGRNAVVEEFNWESEVGKLDTLYASVRANGG